MRESPSPLGIFLLVTIIDSGCSVCNMRNPPRSRSNPPGYDEKFPYEGEDVDKYPKWWRENIQTFREHGMRPYRPPRFVDGEIVPEVIKQLENRWGVDILVRAMNPTVGGNWVICVDGTRIAEIPRERKGDGYTVYGIDSDEFVLLVLNAEVETD